MIASFNWFRGCSLPKVSVQISIRNFSSKKQSSNEDFNAKYCMDLVKKNDHENFLCTLLLDGTLRRHAFAIRAFNVEVARIGSTVSEDQIGKMKLQFWYDSVDKCFESKRSYVSDHPVLRELKYISTSHKITKNYLKRLVAARNRPASEQFITTKQLEEYAEQSVSSLYFLLIELCGIKDLNIDHALSHLGKAQGITTLLRAIPYKGRSQTLNIPQETLIKHGVSQERIIRDKPNDKGVEECVFEIATIAHQHLEKSRKLAKNVPKTIRKLLLPAVAVDRYLDRLRRANFRLTDQSVLQRDSMLPMALYWNKIRSKY